MTTRRRLLLTPCAVASVALAKPAHAGQPPQARPVPAGPPRELLTRAASAGPTARARAAAQLSLSRLEELGSDLSSGRVILANVAAGEVVAYQDGAEALRLRAVVGAPRTPTPPLATFVTSVRTNPPWYVPASLEREVRARGIQDFRVINGRLVQPPGPRNPLGQVRIGLHASDGVFLHGTNNPSLMALPVRALSHGCVRVDGIERLAAWLLGRPLAEVQALIATGRTFELSPPGDIAVLLGYLTAWPDAQGRLVVHADAYGLDAPGARRVVARRVQRPSPAAVEEARLEPPPGAGDDPL